MVLSGAPRDNRDKTSVSGQKDGSNEHLETTLQPITLCMKLFGLYYERSDKYRLEPGVCSDNKTGKIRKVGNCSAVGIYCASVTIILILNFLRCIPAFWVGVDFVHGLATTRVPMSGWYLQSALNAVVMFVSCYRSDDIKKVFEFYNDISRDSIAERLSLKTDNRLLRRRAKRWAGIGLCFLVLNQTTIVCINFLDVFQDVSVVLTSPFSRHISSRIVCCVTFLYCSAAWLLPVCFFMVLCSVLIHQVKCVNKRLVKLSKDPGTTPMDTLNDIRLKHHQYTKVIKLLDQHMSKLLFGLMGTGTFISCFILYQLLNDHDLSTIGICIYAFWLLCNIMAISLTSVGAALVNHEVHSSLDYIHDIDLSMAKVHEIGNLNLYLSKLNGPPIGFTAMDIVTISKGFLLTSLVMGGGGDLTCEVAILTVVTLISHLTDIECLDENPVDKCPPQLYYNSKWKFYTFKLCRGERNSSSLYYHCLQNEPGGYIEFCAKPVNISAGHYPLWTRENGGFIRMAKCSMDTYQDIPMMKSNLFNKCIKTKSKCTELGQLSSFCPDGGATADQQCRCNYKDGWVASQYVIENRHNNVCFIPSQQDSKCLNYFPCKEKEELNPAYQCVPKCPVGYHRPEMEYDCVRISSNGVPSTTDALPGDVTSNNMRTSTDKSLKSKKYNMTLDKSGFMVAVGVSLFILIVLLLVTSGVAVYKRYFSSEKKQNEEIDLTSMDDEHSEC